LLFRICSCWFSSHIPLLWLRAEVGHNLNLAHSGTTEGSYHDKHGMMGYSYNEYFGPKMCFNPAKSWQLGWYEDQSIEWNPNDGTFVGTLVGVDDYGNDYNQFVVLKLTHSWQENIYIGYNRAKGYNLETRMSADMVTVVKADDGFSPSMYVDGLSPGESFTIGSFGLYGKDLTIHFIGTGVTEDEAELAISYGDCVYPSCCDGAMCSSPNQAKVEPPTANPTPKSVTSAPTPTSNLEGTETPQLLLSENFSEDLGSFFALGESVSRNLEDTMSVAKFEFLEAKKPPRIETAIDLDGNTIISVFFWFKANMQKSEDIVVVRYSIDRKQSWERARLLEFGYDKEFQVGQWYQLTDTIFTVPEGTRQITLQIVGITETNDRSDVSTLVLEDADADGNISEFFVGGFACMGDKPSA
jgi:hypothetical protein